MDAIGVVFSYLIETKEETVKPKSTTSGRKPAAKPAATGDANPQSEAA